MRGYYTERNYNSPMPYTDLACERRQADTNIKGVEYESEDVSIGKWERIVVSSKEGEKSICRPMGIYNTLHLGRMDALSTDEIAEAQNEIAKELCVIFDKSDIFPERILVVGLGNQDLTPDNIGGAAAHEVKPTMHIKEFDREYFESLSCVEIAVFTPGVTATSGLDAAVAIRGLCQAIGPDAVIAIDALATISKDRLGSTIQICNTGIMPGSGLGNPRLAINENTVGVPVIAVGVPTIIDSRLFCSQDNSCSEGEAMFVSPKDINQIVTAAAQIIGGSINQAFGVYT